MNPDDFKRLWQEAKEREEEERDMEPHKREGYAGRMAELADIRRKEQRENGF